jgi:hypothetical protein
MKTKLSIYLLNQGIVAYKELFKELLQGVLDPVVYLVPAIAAKHASTDFEVAFIILKPNVAEGGIT